MPARDLPNLGLKAGYDPGEDGWGNDMTLNLLKLSVLTQGTVLSKVAAEPGSPTAGDIHILDETHATHPNEVIVYDGPAGGESWVYIAPVEGWLLFNQAADYYEKFDGAIWAELATGGGGGGGGIADAPSDGTIYGRQDAAWTPVPSGGGGGGGGWVLHDVWDGNVDPDAGRIVFNNLDGYSEVMVLCHDLVSASSTVSGLWFSDDNGATLLGISSISTVIQFRDNGIKEFDDNNVKFTENSYASFKGMINANGLGSGGPIFGHAVNRGVSYFNTNVNINAVAVRTRFTAEILYTGGKVFCYAR